MDKLFKMLGFANRAGKVTLGMTSTIGNLRKRKVQTLILATDLADNAEFTIKSNARNQNVPIFTCCTKDEFGQLFGRNEIGIIGIIDANFAKSINKILKDH